MTNRTAFLSGALLELYGGHEPDECDECRYAFDTSPEESRAIIAAMPTAAESVLEGSDGMTKPEDGSWNATGYVAHLADLARGWAERWAQLRVAPGSLLVGWDPDELANARDYCSLPLPLTMWSLRRDVDGLATVAVGLTDKTTFHHADWGEGNVADAYRWLGHEFHHHLQDITQRA